MVTVKVKVTLKYVKVKRICLICLLFFPFLGFFDSSVFASSATIPLHHWTYDALDRLAAAGLVDMSRLNLKPLDREQVAMIVFEAVERIRKKQIVNISYADGLEEILLKLIEELKPELKKAAPGMFDSEKKRAQLISHIITLQKRIDYGAFSKKKTYLLPNAKGRDLFKNSNLEFILCSYSSWGDIFGFSFEPVFYNGENDSKILLKQAFFNINYATLGLKLGRFSIWYGPGYHGSLLLSDNSQPFETIELKNRRPFYFPGIFEYIGQWNMQFFLSRLEKDRHFPRALITGTRVEVYSLPYLGLGINHTAMFGGEGNGGYSFNRFYNALFATGAGTDSDRINHLASFDLQFILPHALHQYFPISNGLKLYAEIGAEDNLPGFEFIHRGYLFGAYLPGIFQLEDTDLRIEFAQTDPVWYEHGILKSGYKYKENIIGHHMGTDARDYFLELSKRILENLRLKIAFDYEERLRANPATEKRNELNIKLNHDINKNWCFGYGYSFIKITNLDNERGQKNNLHFLSLESTYQF